ncbi:MAG: fumarylacetoacetate hydrolase family protein [Desulfobacterium sp.]|nr:fumarylacetoacetate hydrolase family protein [Desulfobacterium sp.]
MKLSLVKNGDAEPFPVISVNGESWYRSCDLLPEPAGKTVIEILAYEKANPGKLAQAIAAKAGSLDRVDISQSVGMMPFQPKAYRDFMLYEKHCIDASRGFVKKYLPRLMPVIGVYEKLSGKPFPKLKPKKRWYKHPIYYLGNHLNFVTDKDPVTIPSYTRELDYELELGVVICAPLKNASPAEAEKAMGGFVVFNDFSARDVQMDEMASGFGPMKAKNFANAISNIVVSADEILPVIDQLQVSVHINNEKIATANTAGMHYSLAEAIAYASWEEQLHPGEFFGSGTVPGCSGMENGSLLTRNDSIRLEIKGVGILENSVV